MPFLKSLITAVIILILSTISTPAVSSGNFLHIPHADKIVHFFLYLAFSVVLAVELKARREKGNREGWLLIPVVIAAFYGGLIEIIQLYIPGRTGDWFDFLFDVGGSLAGIGLFIVHQKITQ